MVHAAVTRVNNVTVLKYRNLLVSFDFTNIVVLKSVGLG